MLQKIFAFTLGCTLSWLTFHFLDNIILAIVVFFYVMALLSKKDI